jgi:hypothetical protein
MVQRTWRGGTEDAVNPADFPYSCQCYSISDTVEATAAPTEGWEFDRWELAPSDGTNWRTRTDSGEFEPEANPTRFRLRKERTLTAIFEKASAPPPPIGPDEPEDPFVPDPVPPDDCDREMEALGRKLMELLQLTR